MTRDRRIVDAGDRVGIGLDVGDVQVSMLLPKDAGPRDILRATGRLEDEARNEIAFRQRVDEDVQDDPEDMVREEDLVDVDDDPEDIVRAEDPDDQEDQAEADGGTKYGHLLTDGGEIVDGASTGARCEEPDDIFRDHDVAFPDDIFGPELEEARADFASRVEYGDDPDEVVDDLLECYDVELRRPGDPARRLEEIAKQARTLRDQLDTRPHDVAELAGIHAAVLRIAERHDLELDDGRIAGGGER